jgi:hypothetical protein
LDDQPPQGQVAIGTKIKEAGLSGAILSFGGTIWLALGFIGLEGFGGYVPFVCVLIVGISLVSMNLRNYFIGKKLPQSESNFSRNRKTYLLVNRLQYGGLILTLIVTNVLKEELFLMPVIGVIVGLHFIALRNVIAKTPAYLKGLILITVSILSVLLLPSKFTFGMPIDHQFIIWGLVPGIVASATLWSDATRALARGLSLMRATRK